MKTIAVVSCADTKSEEMEYLVNKIQSKGLKTLSIDISTRHGGYFKADISPNEVLKSIGKNASDLEKLDSKVDCISLMTAALSIKIKELYLEKKYDVILGFGGLQNTVMISTAFQELPIDVPKLLVSTVVSGSRTCQSIIGLSNIILIPTLVDIAGINKITKVVFDMAANCAIGTSNYSSDINEKPYILASSMGVVNDGVMNAVSLLKQRNYDVVPIHTTGSGGQILEKLVKEDRVIGVMDLCLHEIVSEDVFGIGFSIGAKDRLKAAIDRRIPLVVAPGGTDFIDVSEKDFFNGILGNPDTRKYSYHNSNLLHVKITKEEAEKVANKIADRLNLANSKVSLLIPLRGFRTETQESEKLYDPEVDKVIIDVLHKSISNKIEIIDLDCNINDKLFSETASNKMMELIG